MKLGKKIIALTLAALLLLALAACGGTSTNDGPNNASGTAAPAETAGNPGGGSPAPASDGKVYTLSIATPQPAESGAGKVLQAACDQMTESTGGRLKFDIYYSGQLLTVFDTVNGVSSGVADIAFLPTSTSGDYFPINGKLLILPFLGYPDDDSVNDIYATLNEEFPQIEAEIAAQNMKTLSTFYFLREDLYFTNGKSVSAPADLNGLKIGVANAFVGSMINQAGGAPVTVTQGDAYTTIESGVAEALVHHDSFIRAGGMAELFNSVTMFGSTGLVREMGKYYINLDSYNGLPEDLRTVVENGFQQVANGTVAADRNISEGLKGQLKAAGCEFNELTDEQVDPFAEAAKTVQDDCVAELEAQGIPAADILARLRELCA